MDFIHKAITAYAIVLIVILVGWVMNVVSLIHMSFDPLTGVAVLRAIGVVVVPLGTIVGYFV